MHHADARLASVRRRKRLLDLSDDLRLTLPFSCFPLAQQYQHRPAPSGTGESGAERAGPPRCGDDGIELRRSEEHTSQLQSQSNIVCRLLLEKKKTYSE